MTAKHGFRFSSSIPRHALALARGFARLAKRLVQVGQHRLAPGLQLNLCKHSGLDLWPRLLPAKSLVVRPQPDLGTRVTSWIARSFVPECVSRDKPDLGLQRAEDGMVIGRKLDRGILAFAHQNDVARRDDGTTCPLARTISSTQANAAQIKKAATAAPIAQRIRLGPRIRSSRRVPTEKGSNWRAKSHRTTAHLAQDIPRFAASRADRFRKYQRRPAGSDRRAGHILSPAAAKASIFPTRSIPARSRFAPLLWPVDRSALP